MEPLLRRDHLPAPRGPERGGTLQEGGDGVGLRGAVVDAARELVGEDGSRLQHVGRQGGALEPERLARLGERRLAGEGLPERLALQHLEPAAVARRLVEARLATLDEADVGVRLHATGRRHRPEPEGVDHARCSLFLRHAPTIAGSDPGSSRGRADLLLDEPGQRGGLDAEGRSSRASGRPSPASMRRSSRNSEVRAGWKGRARRAGAPRTPTCTRRAGTGPWRERRRRTGRRTCARRSPPPLR